MEKAKLIRNTELKRRGKIEMPSLCAIAVHRRSKGLKA
jgi:hypothetical protein